MDKVLITGRFDCLTVEHISLFELGATQGQVIVGLYGDSVEDTDHISLVDRARLVRSCSLVHDVLVVPADDPTRLIFDLLPEYYAEESDYIPLSVEQALDLVNCRKLLSNLQVKPVPKHNILDW